MQGALFGARSLGTGFGPILFATVFSLFSRTDSPFPFFPGAAAFLLPASSSICSQCWKVGFQEIAALKMRTGPF